MEWCGHQQRFLVVPDVDGERVTVRARRGVLRCRALSR